MELSKEVHTLLERIKKLSQQAQKNESFSTTPIDIPSNLTQIYLETPGNNDEITFNLEDLIVVENMDFTDNERWLSVSKNSMVNPYTEDLNKWLRQDFVKDSSVTQFLEFEQNLERNFIDSRTFTRPKKRFSRPSLEQITDYNARLSDSKSSINENLSSDSYHSGPVQFKLSEPIYNTSFDRILASASANFDSFTNMSPPSLMNSLCSSTFTTLMDSGYVNQEVPNEKLEIEDEDPLVTYINEDRNKSKKELNLNDTYDFKPHNRSDANIYKLNKNDLNSTFQKNISNKIESPQYNNNLSNTNTFTKKSKNISTNISSNLSFKSSCPDINKTFQKNHDYSLDLTFQKLSDSQPNLTEDLKRTILNQSMELMNPTGEIFHSARSGSADSLDDRSSSISNSSKDSGKILNLGELDALAKIQEQRLQQAMSTPNKPTSLLLLEENVLSPIQTLQSYRVDSSEDNLSRSDSDLSDSCVSARSGPSTHSSPARNFGNENHGTSLRCDGNVTRTIGPKPEMIVKPMAINRTIAQPSRIQPTTISNPLRPKIRTSSLPRPTMAATGIPRPMSRIPGPKSLRPPDRPIQRQPPKTDWMDGCY